MPRRYVALPSVAFMLTFAFASAVRADDVKPEAPAAAAAGVVFEPGTPAFADVLAKAKADGKPVFIDFATDWCGWCKKLDKDVYTLASVGDLMKAFVNVRVDAEKGEGVALAKRFGVHGFPTLVVVDAAGDEVDRIVGYRKPEAFTTEIGRILGGEGTIPSLAKKYEGSPEDVDTGIALGKKLAPSKPDAAAELFAGLVTKTKDHATQANIHLEGASALMGAGRNEAAAKEAEALVREFADTPAANEVVGRAGGAFVKLDARRALAFVDAARGIAKTERDAAALEQLTFAIHRNGMAESLKRQAEAAGDDPQKLNYFAWTCFEQKVNVKEALGWARTAVEKSDRDPAILDTLANLLWITNAREEAVKIEQEAAGHAKGAMKNEFVANIAKWKAEMNASSKDEDGEEDEGDEGDEDDEKK